MNSGKSIKKGVFWSTIERFSVQGVQFLMTIFISRFVQPEEYGLVAMLGIFIAVANSIVDSGFSNALIQKLDRNQNDYSTTLYFNTATAFFIYLVLWICSPLIAEFYNEPRLELLTKIVCVNIVIRSFSVVQIARFTISMDFKTLSKTSLIGAIISGIIGVLLAYCGFGVWAIVAQALIGSIITTILLWLYSKWLPSLFFSYQSFRHLYSYGVKLMLSGMMHVIYLNLYTLVIGKIYTPTDVGYYNRANTFSQYPSTNIVNITNRVYFPALCEKQNDPDAFAELFHKYLRLICFIVFPLSVCLAAIADPLVRILLTDKWEGAIVPIQIIALAYMLYPVLFINNQPLLALNETGMFLRAEIVKKIIAVVLLLMFLKAGLLLLCISILIYNICDTLIIVAFSRKIMKTGYFKQFCELYKILLSSFLMGTITYLFVLNSTLNIYITLIISLIISFVTYVVFCQLLNIPEIKIIYKLRKYV